MSGQDIPLSPPSLAKGEKRRKDLARIHILKRDLGLDDDAYRSIIATCTRARCVSAGACDDAERGRVVAHLKRLLSYQNPCDPRRGRHPPRSPFASEGGRKQGPSASEGGRRRGWVEPRIRLPEERAPMGRKLCGMLAERGAGNAYADGIALQMFGITRWEFCGATQLHKLLASLVVDQRRRERT